MTNVLTELSNGLAAAVETAAGSVVRVEGRRRLPATGIIWTADGIIATANHVVSERRASKIGLPDGRVVDAEIVGRDPSTDVALLKIEANGLQPLSKAAGDGLKVGHFALALGRPGKTVQATLGIVSALGQSWQTGAGGTIDRYLQTDVVMYPGFSGGPLISVHGELIGLNSSALARGTSLTIPHATVQKIAENLLVHGKIKRGYLGIKTQPVRLPETLATELKQETGLLIAGVENGSPAEQSGLFLGDTIVRFADRSIRHPDDLISLLSGSALEQKTPVVLIRGGQLQEQLVQVGEKS